MWGYGCLKCCRSLSTWVVNLTSVISFKTYIDDLEYRTSMLSWLLSPVLLCNRGGISQKREKIDDPTQHRSIAQAIGRATRRPLHRPFFSSSGPRRGELWVSGQVQIGQNRGDCRRWRWWTSLDMVHTCIISAPRPQIPRLSTNFDLSTIFDTW